MADPTGQERPRPSMPSPASDPAAGAGAGNTLSGGHVFGPVVQAGRIHGGLHIHQPAPALPVPRELPGTPTVCVDRTGDLDLLVEACRGGGDDVRCVAISGPGGIGKSALAVRLLHALDAGTGAAQVHVDLRGHPGQRPLRAGEALARFLRSFGYGLGSALPGDEGELAGWWRSVTARRPVAVLADNARDAAQVLPLWPARAGGVIVVTGRTFAQLAGLAVEGATVHRLRPLLPDAAEELLTRCADTTDNDADHESATRITAACYGNPLAIRAAAAQTVLRPGTTLAQIADRMTRAAATPYPLTHGAVMNVLHGAYDALPPEAGRAFRLIGVLPPGILNADLLGEVCSVDRAEGLRLLEQLLAAELLQDQRSDEQRAVGTELECVLHDEVAALAASSAAGEPAPAREEALRRWVEWYLLAATWAESILTPSHRSLPRSPRYVHPGAPLFQAVLAPQIVAWLEQRRGELLTAVETAWSNGWVDLCWQTVDAMWPLFLRGRGDTDWIRVHQNYGLPAAAQDGNRSAARRMLTTLGGGLRSADHYQQALTRYEQALASARGDGDLRDQAQALDGIGATYLQAGDLHQAEPPLRQALALREEIRDRRGGALTCLQLGAMVAENGDTHASEQYLSRARIVLLSLDEHYEAARAMAYLGRTYIRSGDYRDAELHLLRADQEFTSAGSGHWRARVREWLGEAAHAEGRTADARTAFTESLAMYTGLGSTRDITRLNQQLDEPDSHHRT